MTITEWDSGKRDCGKNSRGTSPAMFPSSQRSTPATPTRGISILRHQARMVSFNSPAIYVSSTAARIRVWKQATEAYFDLMIIHPWKIR
jgi:hypothetical protein